MCLACVALAATLTGLIPSPGMNVRTTMRSFPKPVDAISMTFHKKTDQATLSYERDGTWSDWQPLAVEDEQDPKTFESNMLMLPTGVTDIRVRSTDQDAVIKPIIVSTAPVHYAVAGPDTGTPRIIRRSEWGADESILYKDKPSSSSSSSDDGTPANISIGDTSTGREKDCMNMVQTYPEEFRTKGRRTEVDGKQLRWPQEYSPKVKLLVVHHTAIEYGTDDRSGAERMRALYSYHANNRGWGDIGYHYVVDENGQIYEGKAGGAAVVGGHAYCNNVGTIGIALMGNFEVQKPTQEQMRSLQWLIMTMANEYDIDLGNSVIFHGETLPPVVRHRDLLSTTCPGYYVAETIDQVRIHAAKGNWLASIVFPAGAADTADRTAERKAAREAKLQSTPGAPVVGLIPLGGTSLDGRPGEQMLISVRYQAGAAPVQRDTAVGAVSKSDPQLRIWVDRAGTFGFLRDQLFVPTFVNARDSVTMRLKVQMPRNTGGYTFSIGDVTYDVTVSGRRARSFPDTLPVTPKAPVRQPVTAVPKQVASTTTVPIVSTDASPAIRIRLGYGQDGLSDPASATLKALGNLRVNGALVSVGTVALRKDGDSCIASAGTDIASGTVRIDPGTSIITIDSWKKPTNRYRGIIECRIVDGEFALIDELPLEDYMAGIAEEPDTEPFEKQKAFAVAARSYATYYMDPAHRKFAGKPYDGDDSPARFQMYGGYAFEEKHTAWVKAVQQTAGLVIKKDGSVIRAAFFSADDGRTKSPADVGWTTFPNAEVFQSKDDPWCKGMAPSGHGVGMSGCGAKGQANEGKTYDQILKYYYAGTTIASLR